MQHIFLKQNDQFIGAIRPVCGLMGPVDLRWSDEAIGPVDLRWSEEAIGPFAIGIWASRWFDGAS